MSKNRPNPARRKRLREVSFIDQIEVCGVLLRRIILPNGKRVFEEEGVRELMIGECKAPTMDDVDRFTAFTQPEVRH